MAAPTPRDQNAPGALREFEYTRADFDKLRAMSFSHSGIRVPDDKFDMFYSRLAKRLRARGLTRFQDYTALLARDDPAEFTEFINAITTNLTSFFRENHHFEYLRKTVLPDLAQRKAKSRRLRIWSAGCSTGEEPYSLAMTLLEFDQRLTDWDTRILATDLDTNVLSIAAEGIYNDERTHSIGEARLRKFFQRGVGAQSSQVRAGPELKALIRFKPLNLMATWPMKGPFDVIFCRNVLIYFDNPTKSRLVERFAGLLEPGGHLFIGHSESLHAQPHAFDSLGNTIYRKRKDGA